MEPDLSIQYLIILQNNGIPIYSRCFSDMCAIYMKNEELLSGFLSALTTLPSVISGGGHLSSIEMGETKLVFSERSDKHNFISVIGVSIDQYNARLHNHVINEFFRELENLISIKYKDYTWESISQENYTSFENDLYNNYMVPWFKSNHTSNTCKNGEMCPFRIAVVENISKPKSIWKSLRNTFNKYRKKMKMM